MVLLPEEAEMTLAELRQMAARQQHQIEAQQQLLVAKEQRLKFLKQQEARHHNLAEQRLDTTSLLSLRDKVEAQELKLRQLRALRGQVEQQKTNNVNLGTELDSIRTLFGEKEKELNLAVNKVEELTRQLEEIRINKNRKNYVLSSASELENLKRELIYRTKLTEQQNSFICQQRESIALKQQDIANLDKKINELTQRLHRKRLLNDQLAAQIHSASLSKHTGGHIINNGLYHSATIATIEPLQRETSEPEHTRDDMAAKLLVSQKSDLGEFYLTKNDPKYQTLPYNTKFTLKGKQCEDSLSSTEEESLGNLDSLSSSNKSNPPISQTQKKPSNMCNFSPRPFGNVHHSNLLPDNADQDHNRNENKKPLENGMSQSDTSNKKPESRGVDIYDSVNNNISKPTPNITSPTVPSKPIAEKVKDQARAVPSRTVKPVVPPKPALPVKPMHFNHPEHNVPSKVKKASDKDTVNAALSVLQNKSSEEDKSAISNYKERLLYYQCVPRYPSARSSSVDQSVSKHKISTYFPKGSRVDLSSSKDSHDNENCGTAEVSKRRPAFGQLPIKPKPLTIRKTPGLEPPKLKVQPVVSSSMQRKISDSQLISPHMKANVNSQISTFSENSSLENVSKVTESKEPEITVEVPQQPEETVVTDKQIKKSISLDSLETEFQATEKGETFSGRQQDEVDISKTEKTEVSTEPSNENETQFHNAALRALKKGNLKNETSFRVSRRVSFDPLALLLDAALEGELELVKKTASEVPNPSAANDEGITALHNAICAGHFDVVQFLVEFGCDVNAQDSDGWTPLHCAASCNNLPMVKFLVERGACIFATTLSDHETAAEKCEEDEEGFDGCSEYLYSLQENLGVINNSVVYAVYDYEVQNADELSFKDGDMLTVLRKGDDEESEWWWSRLSDREGYVPRNLLGLYPRVKHRVEETS